MRDLSPQTRDPVGPRWWEQGVLTTGLLASSPYFNKILNELERRNKVTHMLVIGNEISK